MVDNLKRVSTLSHVDVQVTTIQTTESSHHGDENTEHSQVPLLSTEGFESQATPEIDVLRLLLLGFRKNGDRWLAVGRESMIGKFEIEPPRFFPTHLIRSQKDREGHPALIMTALLCKSVGVLGHRRGRRCSLQR